MVNQMTEYKVHNQLKLKYWRDNIQPVTPLNIYKGGNAKGAGVIKCHTLLPAFNSPVYSSASNRCIIAQWWKVQKGVDYKNGANTQESEK